MAEEYDNLTLFATIRTLHAQGNDLLSAICSLVLQSIEDGASIDSVQATFGANYLTDIPLDSARTVLKRLKSYGFVEYGSNFSNIKLTDTGRQEKSKLQKSVRDLRRDFTALVDDMRIFYINKKYSEPKNYEQELLLFIDQNIGYTSSIMRGSKHGTLKSANHVAEYFAHLEQSSPEKFKLLQNIFFGRVYINIIRTRDTYAKNIILDATKVYLDTNLLLSILGFHDDSSTKQAKELLDILRKTQKIDVLVFDETIIEARQLLQSAGKEMSRYSSRIPVDSIYYKLKVLGHTKESITILMENLENSINQEGIGIVTIPIIDEDSIDYKTLAADISSASTSLDRPKAGNALRHDARILSAIKILRKDMNSKLFEKSQQLFVTPDIAVNAVTHDLAKHEFKYPLSISVTEVVSTLWIRNLGDEKIATNIVRQSIMAYVRERAISHELWEKFMTAIEEAALQKRLSKDDIAILMSDEETSRILAEKQYDAPAQLVSDKHIKAIRDTREKDLKEKQLADGIIDRVSIRINSISSTVATICVVLLGIIISVLLAYVFYASVSIVGLDNFANGWGLFTILLMLSIAIVFGVQLKLSQLIGLRSSLIDRIQKIVAKAIRRMIGFDR